MWLVDAVRKKNLDAVSCALNDLRLSQRELNEAFHVACELGYSEVVSLLLDDKRLDSGAPSTKLL